MKKDYLVGQEVDRK